MNNNSIPNPLERMTVYEAYQLGREHGRMERDEAAEVAKSDQWIPIPNGKPIGWFDECDPHGSGYRVMTADGLKVFDKNEHDEYLVEKQQAIALALNHGNGRQ